MCDGWLQDGRPRPRNEDGYYTIVDRKKSLIIRGGYNVYPREIEEAVHEHPAVAETAVIGVPHPELGEEVGAAVALKPGRGGDPRGDPGSSSRRESLRTSTRGRSGSWPELPKGPTGKILRREVKRPAAAGR